jgi:hypothetical protein
VSAAEYDTLNVVESHDPTDPLSALLYTAKFTVYVRLPALASVKLKLKFADQEPPLFDAGFTLNQFVCPSTQAYIAPVFHEPLCDTLADPDMVTVLPEREAEPLAQMVVLMLRYIAEVVLQAIQFALPNKPL